MTTTIIQEATIDDLRDIQQLNIQLFTKEHKEYDHLLNLDRTWSDEWATYFRNRILEDDWCVFLAKLNWRIVWYICWWVLKEDSWRYSWPQAELENMYILDDYRGAGIWTELINAFRSWCSKNSIKKIRLEVAALNSDAISFYQKNGFSTYSLIQECDV